MLKNINPFHSILLQETQILKLESSLSTHGLNHSCGKIKFQDFLHLNIKIRMSKEFIFHGHILKFKCANFTFVH
jgi:hypothetical protein